MNRLVLAIRATASVGATLVCAMPFGVQANSWKAAQLGYAPNVFKGLSTSRVGKYVPAAPELSRPKRYRNEITMNAKPVLAGPHVVTTIVAAALSALIAIGLLSAVTGLFRRDGAPLEHVVIAERACANYAFVSERGACVRLFLTASRVRNVASR